MLMQMKSVADYINTITDVDLSTAPIHNPNLIMYPSTIIYSSANGRPKSLHDIQVDSQFYTDTDDSPCYLGAVWGDLRKLDGIKYYWPSGSTAPTVKIKTYDGVDWSDNSSNVALSAGWNTLRLTKRTSCYGVQVVYVSEGVTGQLRCSELEVYGELRIAKKPTTFASGGVIVLHGETDLSSHSQPLVTVGAIDQLSSITEIGFTSAGEELRLFIGVHADSEHELEQHRQWLQLILDTALAPNEDGIDFRGIPMKGILFPMTWEGSNWWISGQPDWFASPSPVLYVDGTVTVPDDTDYGRGRVQLNGTSSSNLVHADFTCGVWEFVVENAIRGAIENPGKVQHHHNMYFMVKSDVQHRSISEALI